MKKIFNMFLIVILLTISLSSVYANEEPMNLPKIGTLAEVQSLVKSADFSHDDKYIVTGHSNGEIAVWKSDSVEFVTKWQATDASRGIQKVIYNPDSSRIISSDEDATIKIWDVSTGKLLHKLDASKGSQDKGVIYDIAVNKDGTRLYSANENRKSVTVWSMNTGETLSEKTFTSKPLSLAYNPLKQQIAISLENEGLNIYDAIDGSYELVNPNKHLYRNAKYTSDYKRLMVPTYYNLEFGQPLILDVEKDYKSINLDQKDYKKLVSSVYIDLEWRDFDISPNDRYTAVTDYGVAIVDNKTKKIFTELDIRTNGPIKFNNDGNRLLAGNTLVDTSSLPNVVTTGIEIEVGSVDMNPKEDQAISVKELFSDGTNKEIPLTSIDFTSSHPDVASMLYGEVNSHKEGTTTIKASYEGFTDDVIINVEKHKAFEKKIEVEADKEWTISFNMDVNLNTIAKDNISIINKDGQIIPIIINTTENMVKIKPINDYKSGEKYTIWIRNLQSKTGVKLKENTKMDFQVKSTAK